MYIYYIPANISTLFGKISGFDSNLVYINKYNIQLGYIA